MPSTITPRRIRFAAAITIALVTVATPLLKAADPAPATQPSTQPNGAVDALTADVEKQFGQIQDVLGSPEILTDAAKRTAAAPQAIPSLKKLVTDFDALIKADPENAKEAADRRAEFTMFLALFGDADSAQKLNTEATSSDPAQVLEGQRSQLMITWLTNAKNNDAQTGVADKLEALAKQNPSSTALTIQLYQMSQMGSSSPDISKRLTALVTDVMKNEVADAAKAQINAGQKLAALENKPLTVAGKQPDGKDFTTADWKGKVILVDFWATWCGPCREELPRVVKMYNDYHPKGLEILGVSNDFSADDLAKFLAENKNMPWPQLLDTTAAANHQFSPITLGYGIEGIPTMFLIDKKGVLRTVNARENMETLIPQLLDEK